MQPRQLQAKPFFFAATKIRIGRGRSLPLRNQQAKPFSPASIRKFGLEIKNRCTKEGENGEKLTSILKSGPEIKNRCTQEGLNREKLASIPKFGLEIRNHCSDETVLQAKPFFLRRRRLESDAEDRSRHGRCRRNHSSSPRRN